VKRIIAVILATILSGCAGYVLVQPGPVEVASTIVLQPTQKWSRLGSGKRQTWTADGIGLQMFQIMAGLEEGDTLFNPAWAGKSPPKFSKSMSILEIKDFIANSMAASGAKKFTVIEFEPAKIDGKNAVRTDYTFTLEDGLLRQGFAFGIIHEKKLSVLMYHGANIHYFGKHKDNVEDMLRTIKIL
jgi:hypothetical protein